MSSSRKEQGGRPTLPPIRDVFRDEFYNPSRPRPDSPALTLARLRVDDGDAFRGTMRYSAVPLDRQADVRRLPTQSSDVLQHPSLSRSRQDPMPPQYPRGVPAYPTSNQNGYLPPPPSSSRSRFESQEVTPVARYPSHSLPYDPRYAPHNQHHSMSSYHPSDHRHIDELRTPTSYRQPESAYASHSQTHHLPPEQSISGSKYECNYCGKGFNRPSSLKACSCCVTIHLNSHTGEKPFQCPVEGCGRSFSVLSNMRRHARVHNPTPSRDLSGDEGSEDQRPTARSGSTSSYPVYESAIQAPSSAARWQHRRNSSASTSSSGSRRSRSVSSESEDEETSEARRPGKRSRNHVK